MLQSSPSPPPVGVSTKSVCIVAHQCVSACLHRPDVDAVLPPQHLHGLDACIPGILIPVKKNQYKQI